MGVGPVCWTSLPTGLSEWKLGPRHTEWSPILFLAFWRLEVQDQGVARVGLF